MVSWKYHSIFEGFMKYFKISVTIFLTSNTHIYIYNTSRTWTRLYFNPHIHLSKKNFRHDPSSFYLPEFILPNST